jgi:hypothetical protein
MSSSFSKTFPYFELLRELAVAHGLPSPNSPDEIREFTFMPGGANYRLIPQPQDDTQALLEIDITSLESLLNDEPTSPTIERLLRSFLQLNAVLQEETQWLISLDEEDVLVLSTPVTLTSTSAEAVQALALQGLQRSRALLDWCQSLEPLVPA